MKQKILSRGLDAIKSIAFSLPITIKEVAKASALAALVPVVALVTVMQ